MSKQCEKREVCYEGCSLADTCNKYVPLFDDERYIEGVIRRGRLEFYEEWTSYVKEYSDGEDFFC